MSFAQLPASRVIAACAKAEQFWLAEAVKGAASDAEPRIDRIRKLSLLADEAGRTAANVGLLSVDVEDFSLIQPHY